jgi:fumarylacetoacetase
MIKANNPQLKSWVNVPQKSDFPIQNLPFGVFSKGNGFTRLASRIGDKVIDLARLNALGYFSDLNINQSVFENNFLNDFIELGKEKTNALRERLSELLQIENTELQNNSNDKSEVFFNIEEVKLHLPVYVRDYTDFYSSIEHATNVGTMFRDPNNALLPNWRHIPVGYHGRASSIILSGEAIYRPKGQTKADDAELPSFGPSRLLDFELEMAFVIGKKTSLGDNIKTEEANNYIFGMCLFNDWSARDIQKWEYVPLGPFLAKNFASSISPWIVTLEALEPFKVAGPKQEPEVLPYLKVEGENNYDINLEVIISPENNQAKTVSISNFKYMYWNMNQQLAHHTVNGCNVNVGDMMASGTISGKSPDSYGSMLEIAWGGKKPITMPDGTERKFILDNDTVIMKGFGEKDGVRVGFGEVSTKVLPAK